MDNMVIYKSPEFANTTVTAMYSNGIGGDEQKWSHNDHYYGIGLDFNKNETVFSVMVEMYDNKDLNADKTYLVTLAVSRASVTGRSGQVTSTQKAVR